MTVTTYRWGCPRAPGARSLRRVDRRIAVEDALGDGFHRLAALHRGLLYIGERRLLGHAGAVHQQALGSIDHLAGLESLGERGRVLGKGAQLAMAAPCDLDRGHQLAALVR